MNNLSVPEGSVFGFIGKNGAGKTTTMKMVLGLLQSDNGEIRSLVGLNGAIKQIVDLYLPVELGRQMGVKTDFCTAATGTGKSAET